MTDDSARPVALRQKRDATIVSLCDHFALDNIDAEELERLIDRAHLARTTEELDLLLSHLPDRQPAAAVELMSAGEVEHDALIVAIMGGAERKGAWSVGRSNRVIAVMGGAMLDFRNVRLPPGVTEIQVLALMGGVEIIVPPHIRVSSDGIGIMGAFEHVGTGGPAAADPASPMLRISGLALMGGVEITERMSGESSGDARRRRRRESKLRGEEQRALRDRNKP
jgi:hypothetical protein